MSKRRTEPLESRRRRQADDVRLMAATGNTSGYYSPNRTNGDRSGTVSFGTAESAIATQAARLTMIDRCRAAYRQNGIFTRIVNALKENIIGTGFRVEAQTADPGWNRAAEEILAEQNKRENFSPSETLSERESAVLMCISHYRDGGVLVYHPYGGTQLFEEFQIVTPRGKSADANVRDGLVFNNAGKLQGYYVGPYSRWGYVDDGAAQYLPAWHVDTDLQVKLPVCVYIRSCNFISGYRGIPMLAPCLDDLDRIGDYIDAVLERAIEEACIMGTLHSDDPNASDSLSVKRTDDTSTTTTPYNKVSRLEPGVVPLLRKDEEFKIHGISAPGGNFEPFMQMLSRLAALPASMPLEIAMMDFSDTNFAASRASIEQFKLCCVMGKAEYAEQWYTPNYHWRIYEAIKRGDLTRRDDWQAHKVSPSGWRYLEPSKDAAAATERMANKTSNLAAELAEQGKGLIAHLNQTAEVILAARQVAADKGVDVSELLGYAQKTAAAPAAQPPQDQEEAKP